VFSKSFTFFFALRSVRSFSLCVMCVFTTSSFVSFCARAYVCMCVCCVDFMECVTLHVRIANWVGEDSRCRGGIVNIRFGFSCALLERPEDSKALWRFRVSTSNSPSGRTRPQTNTQFRHIYYTYARQDIRVYEDDHI